MIEEPPEPTAAEIEKERWHERRARHDRWAAWCLLGLLATTVTGVLSLNWTWGLPAWSRSLILAAVWAPPLLLAMAGLYHLALLNLCNTLLRDIHEAAELMKEEPPVSFHTIHWMVTRRRLWRRLMMPAYWLAAELGTGLLLGAMIWAEISPGILNRIAVMLIALVSLTLTVMLVRLATFLTASRWLATRRGGSRLSES